MNQIEAGIKENQILGKRLARHYADLMCKYAWLWHDTAKGIYKIFEHHPERERIFQVIDPLIDFCMNEVLNNKSLKNIKVKAAKAISAWADIIEAVLKEKEDLGFEEFVLLLGRAYNPVFTLSPFIYDEYSNLTGKMMDEWDCCKEIQKAHRKLVEITKENYNEIRVCLLTLKLIEKVFEHFENLIDEEGGIYD